MALKRPQPLPTRNVPQYHLPVPARAHHPVVLQPDRVHGALVTPQGTVQLERLLIPHPNQRVLRAASPSKP